MNRRERNLLDKQLRGADPRAPANRGALGLTFVAVFLGGLFLGGWLFAHKPQTTDDQMIALFHVNGAPPTMR
jgi:hypothetical protein